MYAVSEQDVRAPLKTALASWAPSINVIVIIIIKMYIFAYKLLYLKQKYSFVSVGSNWYSNSL